MEQVILSSNESDTLECGRAIGARLKGGEVLQLIGDLGSGKTTFTKGVCQALNVSEPVSSPTFTVCQIYHGALIVRHYDFYRLGDDALIGHELADAAPDDVIIAEWAGNLFDQVARPLIVVQFDYADNETSRRITLRSKNAEYSA